ncbi:hypothetical protein ACIRP0_10955 [Streptomyces sp. NPDC101733]|uniref:hypothetical protein n=1 Tax=unclassified Streptomyces TaxID=2593676 RepID=UPI00382E0BB4
MSTRRPVRTGRLLLGAGFVLAAAVVVLVVTVVRAADPDRNPLHRAADAWLEAVATGAATSDTGCSGVTSDPAAALRRLEPGFGHGIVSSTESDGEATVNVDLTPARGSVVAYSLDLRRTGTHWQVCSASAGHVEIDPFD